MKLKNKKTPKSILSDKIADALTVKPRADIEDDHVFNTKPSTISRNDLSSSDSEDEAAISDFRKRNVNLLSEISKKYEGQVVSRKDIDAGDSDDGSSSNDDTNTHNASISEKLSKASISNDDSEEESDDYNITNSLKQLENSRDEDSDGSDKESDETDNQENDDDDDDDDDDEEDEGEGYDISQMDEPVKEEFEHVKKQNMSEEAKKGTCVRNQLLIWENLLEMRIHLQRCMNTANRMPFNDVYNELKSCNEFVDEASVTVHNVANVLDKFLVLQNLLLNKFPETKSISNKKQTEQKAPKDESDEEIPSDTDNEEIPSDTDTEENVIQDKKQNVQKKTTQKKRKLVDYESDIATCHKVFKTFRDSTIQKWNEKTRLATAANIKNTPTNTILQQISYILSDRDKLIRRTQLKRSEYDIIGYKKEASQSDNNDQNGVDVNSVSRDRKDNDEYIPEIFDDSDFYHQLLRELIECKSADVSDPVQLSRQWIALQQMRSKMKRKVDTRATKGRKIKYVVHNPLVSYMAPEKSIKWNDESCDELYSSLFGKIFENNNVGINVNLENV
ncbi:protein AATF-like [Vanessa cardui]|uniref:protein AATF-like n=1 Tax=Vanessa cardui TaxID=171605 RepID=UPI001F134560|nr:protein AATF-like [Vanessa cardui]